MTASGTRTISINRRCRDRRLHECFTITGNVTRNDNAPPMHRNDGNRQEKAACLCDRRRDGSSCHPPRFFHFVILRITLTVVFFSYFIERSCKLTMSCEITSAIRFLTTRCYSVTPTVHNWNTQSMVSRNFPNVNVIFARIVISEFYTFDLMEVHVKNNVAKLIFTLNFKIKFFFYIVLYSSWR